MEDDGQVGKDAGTVGGKESILTPPAATSSSALVATAAIVICREVRTKRKQRRRSCGSLEGGMAVRREKRKGGTFNGGREGEEKVRHT